jgi:hypothetical protein
VGLIAHIMRAYVTEENKFFIGPAQPWVVGLETCYPKWPLMKTRATVSSTWASTHIIHRLQDKQSSDPWSSLHSVWPPGNFSSRKTETRLTSSVWQTETKMAQTLAIPVVPSLSAICNGLKNTSLSSSISPPVSNPPKVALPFLFLL